MSLPRAGNNFGNDRFTTVKLVLGHLGESLPFIAWRIQHGINFSPNRRFTKKRLDDYLAENILGHHKR